MSASKLRFASKLRRNATEGEKAVRRLLNASTLRWQFQAPMRGWILDFYCSRVRVAVEIDGSSHDDKELKDSARDTALRVLGIVTLRYSESEAASQPQSVVDRILRFCSTRPTYTTWNQKRKLGK